MALEDYRSTMIGCTRCSFCKWIPLAKVKSWRFAKGCPSVDYYGFHTWAAGGRLTAALSLLEGRSSYSNKIKDIVYQCHLCGTCDVTCKVCRYDMEPLETLQEFRFKLVEDGQTLPQHQPIIDNLHKENNMLMKTGAERGKWADGLGLAEIGKKSNQVIFFAGCRLSFDGELQKVARAAISVFKKAGVDVGIMGDSEMCCGSRAYSMGYREEFKRLAKANISAWAKSGVKTIVTSCADCYWAFKRLYPRETEVKFEVLHTVEFINQLVKQGKLKLTNSVPMTVTYHDPCHLGRQGEPYVPWAGTETKVFGKITKHTPPKPRYNGAWGVYEPPRDVLKAIPDLKLVEMERNRESAWCCGAGGGVRETYPDFSTWTARERIEEAIATGAEALVTACPWCERNFIDAINVKSHKIRVFDVVELVQQAI